MDTNGAQGQEGSAQDERHGYLKKRRGPRDDSRLGGADPARELFLIKVVHFGSAGSNSCNRKGEHRAPVAPHRNNIIIEATQRHVAPCFVAHH